MSEPRSKLDGPLYGRYKLLRELGAGGMGIVHLAHDLRMRREVAIKRAHRSDGAYLERFRREFKALSAIRHRGVPIIYDVGDTSQGEAFFTMEIVKGETLFDLVRGGALEPMRALTLALELGRVLMAVHEVGIIHRDVKPNNIIIEPGDQVRLLDFGVCALTDDYYRSRPMTVVGQRYQTGDYEWVGNPAYTDPQHFSEGRTSPQNDVFSVCVVLYECVKGRPLYDYDTQRHREIVADEFEPELAPLVAELQRGVADTNDRHRTMAELVRALEIVRSKIAARPAPSSARPASRARLGPVAALVAVAATSFALGRFSHEAPTSTPTAPAPVARDAPTPAPMQVADETPNAAPMDAAAWTPDEAPAWTPDDAPASAPEAAPTGDAGKPSEPHTAKPRARPRPPSSRAPAAATWEDRMGKAEKHARRCLEDKGVTLQPLTVVIEPGTPGQVVGFMSSAPETTCVRAALKRFDLAITEGQSMHTFFE